MRPAEEIAEEIISCSMAWEPAARIVGNVTAEELRHLAESMQRWAELCSANSRDRQQARAEHERLRTSLRLAETTRNAAQEVATRETLLRREVEQELEKARAERNDAMDLASANAAWCRHYQRARATSDTARAEADELRRLAWRWCIEARRRHEEVLRLSQRVGYDGMFSSAYSEAMADESADDAHIVRKHSDFDVMAKKAGPLPTAVLAGPLDDAYEVDHRGRHESPIESLGPVPAESWWLETWTMGHGDTDQGKARMRMAVAWLIRDAVRRGARLEEE